MSVFDPLTSRFKLVILIMLLFVAAVYAAVIQPSKRTIRRLSSRRSNLEARITEVSELHRIYGKAFAGLNIYPERDGERISNIALMSHLENLARQEGMGEMITYMKPCEERNLGTLAQYLVEMRFDSITPSEMIAFLYALEVEDGLFGIVQSTLEPARESGATFDLTLLLSRNVSF